MKVHIGPHRKNRRVHVHIDDYDLWNGDVTLATIIAPLLKKYSEQLQGSPTVDNEDVPEHLRATSEEMTQMLRFGETDSNFHLRWKYVVDEMHFAMSAIAASDNMHFEGDEDKRINNGLRLFGKYMRGIWT